jgi:hypothetical protein
MLELVEERQEWEFIAGDNDSMEVLAGTWLTGLSPP